MAIPEEMKECVLNHANLAAGIGAATGGFIPHADIPAMIGIWVDMLAKLSIMSGRELNAETAKRMAVTVCVGVGLAQGAVKTVTAVGTWLLAVPSLGLSFLFGAAANSGLDYATTRVVGMQAAELLMADKLTPENLMHATLSALGLQFTGWGSKGPPNPSDYDI